MHRFMLLNILLLVTLLSRDGYCNSIQLSNASDGFSCPPWAIQKDKYCKCGFEGVATCDKDSNEWTISLPLCYCLIKKDKTLVVGTCLFTCYIGDGPGAQHTFHTNSTNISMLCKKGSDIHHGHMCQGGCVEGYALSVYSYSLACVKCSDYKYNWLKYITAAFLPLTMFYLALITFRISVTSGVMTGYVLLCQLGTCPFMMRGMWRTNPNGYSTYLTMDFFAIWNLDFFCSMYTPFCLHPKMSTLQTLALEYVIAVYPLFLIIITYFLVHLHDNYPVIVRLWRPFYKCFIRIRNQWEIRSTLIEAFATFLLLSYVKILNTSCNFLAPTVLLDKYGTKQGTFLVYDPTIKYFGKDHLPYAVIALIMTTVFNIFPLLLLSLYPCGLFQRCLYHCRLHSHVLHTFMDAFLASYKTKPLDCRYFAVLYILIRVISLGEFCVIPIQAMVVIVALLSLYSAFLIALIKPHSKLAPNVVSSVVLLLLGLTMLWLPLRTYYKTLHLRRQISFLYTTPLFLAAGVTLLGMCVYGCVPRRWLRSTAQRISKIRQKLLNETETDSSLPPRLEHPSEFTPLITS